MLQAQHIFADCGANATPQCLTDATPYRHPAASTDSFSSHTTKTHHSPNPNMRPIVLLPRLKDIYKSSTNPPRNQNRKGNATPPPIVASVNSPPPFVFDADSIRLAREIIDSHSAALMETTTEVDKEKAKYDEAVNQQDVDLEHLLATIDKQTKLTQ